jgi:nucleotide-binding universal stress UspA family protein
MIEPLASRVLWALDPVQDNRAGIDGVAPFLKGLTHGAAEIYPTYILGPGFANFPIGGPSDLWLQDYALANQSRLAQLLGGVDLPGLQPPEVMVYAQTTLQQALAELLAQAKTRQIDLIVIQHHGRSGMRRRLFGSFTDELVAQSSIPVMVVNPDSEIPSRESVNTVFFATDFSVASKKIFRFLVQRSRALGQRLILFHALSRSIDPLLESGAGFMGNVAFPVEPSLYADDWARKRKRAHAWSRWAGHQGVRVDVLVDHFALNVADSIVKVAGEQHADLIAMVFHKQGTVAKHVLHASALNASVCFFHDSRAA